MSIALETTLLSPERLDAAVEIQSRAFYDDPLFEFIFPVEERASGLPWIMRVGIQYGLTFGHVNTNAGVMLGHAVWLPPGHTDLDPEGLHQSGFSEAEKAISPGALQRFGAFMDQIAPTHTRLMPEPHWYLMILGVDPPHQGQGVGGALLQPVLREADAARLPCYLETAKERNLRFYQKHGFEVADEDRIAGSGPRVWMMVRGPR